MANANKIFQLLRSSDVFSNHDAAMDALKNPTFLNNRVDGELCAARYTTIDGKTAAIIGVVTKIGTNIPSLTYIDIEELEVVISTALTKLKDNMGFESDGTYKPESSALSGMNVTQALDYLANNAADLNGAVVDNEEVTAQTFGKIRSILGITSEEMTFNGFTNPLIQTFTNFTDTCEALADGVNTALTTKADAATTLAGYGITDAKIEGSKITLGPNNITVLTSQSLDGYATETYVEGQISNLVNGAPEALDTLKEIADRLGEDSDAMNAVNEILTGKADKSDAILPEGYTPSEDENPQPEAGDSAVNAISKLHKVVLDDELVTATALSAIKENLGFESDGTYNPTAAMLAGMTVAQALDYLGKTNLDNEEVIAQTFGKIKNILGVSGQEMKFEGFTNEIISGFTNFTDAFEALADAVTVIDCGTY